MPSHGRSKWFSQTQPVPAHRLQAESHVSISLSRLNVLAIPPLLIEGIGNDEDEGDEEEDGYHAADASAFPASYMAPTPAYVCASASAVLYPCESAVVLAWMLPLWAQPPTG
jgi:hypothetical protein